MSAPIGILGGIFDPVHNGHLAVARLAMDFFGLETVHFIPSGTPPHKASTVSATAGQRLAMLKLAVAGHKGFTVCEDEIHRDGVSYTIDTLAVLQKKYPGRPLHFIIGSDNLTEIRSWRRYRDIMKMIVLCVAHRPGHSLKPPDELDGAQIVPFPSPEWGLSSTRVRAYFAKGYDCSFLMPDSVLEYVRNNGLYHS